MSFGTYTNGATSDVDPFNGFRPPYKIAQKITFPNITGRDAPGKTGSAAKPAMVSSIGIRVSGYGGDTATTRFGMWSSTGTNGKYSGLFTLPTNDTPPLVSEPISPRLVFSTVQYYIGFTKTSTSRYTWGVDSDFTDSIRQDNTNSGSTDNFKDDGLISPAGVNGSLVFEVDYDVLPTAPTSPSASVSGTTINLTWGAVSSTGGQPVTGYRIQRSTDNINFTTIVGDSVSLTRAYTDTNLVPGFTYYYRIAARNLVALAHGFDYSGPYSATVSGVVASTAGNAQSLLTVTVANPEPDALQFSDFGDGIQFTQIDVSYGSEYLYNEIEASTQDSFAEIQIASAPASKTRYGVKGYSVTSLLNSNDAGALAVAKDLLTYYYQPELRVDSITIDLSNLSISEVLQVLDLEIDSYISVSFTPNGVGDPKIASGLVTGITHRITINTHEVELRLRNERTLFTLNSDSKGILDQNILGP